MSLTRAQLAALTDLHRRGEAWGQGRGIGLPGPRQRTLNALVSSGLARFDADNGRRFTPAVRTWADGFGAWHVNLPDDLDNPAAVARAVIRGEVWARNDASAMRRYASDRRGVPRWRLDVERERRYALYPDGQEWREVTP